MFYSSFFKALRTNLPLTSYKTLKVSLVFSMERTSITPKGNPLSLLICPSILMLASLSFKIMVQSLLFKAYFNFYLKITYKGIHCLNLWGPWEGLTACNPPSFPNIQDLGAAILF
mmetsp:Transcript_67/g.7  ORF Transcript_67/g.7 Transcript_67/m.7 type:complete len:115 (-) Transcript_67:73-417(-)